ncbi:MAG: zinc ABC transporter substrate-binding protein [Bacteroidota bacterium]
MKLKPILYTLVTLLIFSQCSPPEQSKNNTIKVVATTGMIYDAVSNIAGDSIETEVLMGPGVDPHLYKATQGDIRKLNQADIIFYNGLHLEGKMGEIFEKLGQIKRVIPVAESLPNSLIIRSEEFQNAVDPHIWFDVKRWKYAVVEINKQLSEIKPEQATYFNKNTQKYLAKLDSLDASVKYMIAQIPKSQRILITSHDAFGYFGDAYDIEVKGLQGISTVSEYGLRDLAIMSDLIIDRQIKSVFVETSISERAIQSLVEGVNEQGYELQIGGSLYSDAMGDFDTPEGTYIGMVSSNTKTIVNALK